MNMSTDGPQVAGNPLDSDAIVDSNGDNELASARRTLAHCPERDPDRYERCRELGNLLWKRYEETNSAALLEECTQVREEALDCCPFDSPFRAHLSWQLVDCLKKHFDVTGDRVMLDEAISLCREAIAQIPTGYFAYFAPYGYGYLVILLVALSDQTGDESIRDEIVTLSRTVSQITSVPPTLKAEMLGNLATSLTQLFMRKSDDNLLNEATALHRDALNLWPSEHPGRAGSYTSLAVVLKMRYKRTGDTSMLNEAVKLEREALRLHPAGHPFRFASCANLAISLNMCFKLTQEKSLLDEVIVHEREALDLLPVGHPDRPISCSNLAYSLSTCFKQSGDEVLLDESIALHREAMELSSTSHAHRPQFSNNLASALTERFARTEDISLLREIILLREEVLTTLPPGHPVRWKTLVHLAHIHIDPLYTDGNVHTAVRHLAEAISSDADDLPELLNKATHLARCISTLDLSNDLKRSLLQSYAAAIHIALLVTGFLLDPQTQLHYLATCRTLGPAAYSLARGVGDLELGLQLLERARGIVWSQILHSRDPQMQGVPRAQAHELRDLLHALNTQNDLGQSRSEYSNLTEQDLRHQRHSRIQQILREIRTLPGMQDFMLGPTHEALITTAATHPVVILIEDIDLCYALIIRSSREPMSSVELHIDPSEVRDLIISSITPQRRGSYSNNLRDETVRMGMKISQKPSSTHHMLAKLWESVVKPVIRQLGPPKASGKLRPRIQWCPTGIFTFTPVHAAGIYEGIHQECLSDYAVSSYTPTLAALLRAQKTANTYTGVAQVSDLAGKANASVEVHCTSDSATTTQVAASFQSANFVHIACHGIQHPTEPLKSGFCLSDGNLTMTELMKLDLKDAFFAFLSACETAHGDPAQPDQIIHLAASMLFAGFKSVVATMWAMNDGDGPFVASRFYRNLLESKIVEAETIPYALDQAVTELRRTGVPPERWATFIHVGA